MELFNNPWVVGILGGVISGLIVFFVTKYIFSKKENKEYIQRVKTANNEIFYSIRLLIADKALPKDEYIEALIFATSTKYNVDYIDLYSTYDLAEDLIKEIMDNIFLSSKEKLEYCELLKEMKDFDEVKLREFDKNEIGEKEGDRKERVTEYNKKNIEFLSIAFALMTTLFTLLYFLNVEKNPFFEDAYNFIYIIVVITIIPLFVLMLLYQLKKIKRKKDTSNDDK